ncbi:hypothetical protein WG902_03635 [Ramlibacter sp. PS3R-8]|uniref:hypothetical protein n=1 Tax=Ramlibacter sp. PS3R-8 TaxID=3133437 RepID=UPI0030A50652
MEPGLLPPLALGPMLAAARDLAFRVSQFVAAAPPRLPGRPVVVVAAAILSAWTVISFDWSFGFALPIVTVGCGSVVATITLVAGWRSDPDEIERWSIRAVIASLIATVPALFA